MLRMVIDHRLKIAPQLGEVRQCLPHGQKLTVPGQLSLLMLKSGQYDDVIRN